MSDLLKLIQAYLSQANIRGIDPENPIPFFVRSPDGQPNEGKQFVVQVGYAEPTFNQLPYSVLWICFDKESDMHAKLYRRVSHHPSGLTPELSYTWMEITEYGQVFEKEQFYVPVADLDLVDGDTQIDPVMVASTESLGTVLTTDPVVEPRAILATDPRMTNAREALPHTHEDEPRSMLMLYEYEVPLLDENDQPVVIDGQELKEVKRAYVKIDSAFPSEEGEILFIKEKDPDHEHVWIGEWRKARPEDIESTGPKVVSARIVSPTDSFEDNQQYDLNWEVTYDDDHKELLEPTWVVSDNVLSIDINDQGVLDIPDISEDTQVTVTATATYDGKDFTDSLVVDIADTFTPVSPERIEITGPKTVKELESGKYTVTLYMTDSTTAKVTPDSFTSDNTDAAIIDINGNMTTYDIDANQPVTLTATYSIDGQTLSATYDMTVLVEVLDWEVEIRGASSMDELTTETYQVFAVDENGGETLIVPDTFEISNGQAYASLVGMELTANDVVNAQRITLRAEHTTDGVTKNATKTVDIRDLTAYPSSIEVTFPAQMDELASEDMSLQIVYDDGSKVPLTDPDTVRVSNVNALTYTAPLTITSKSVTSATTVSFTVEHTVDGKKVSGTATTTINNTVTGIVGLKGQQDPIYVNENGGTVGLHLSLVMDDGSTETIEDHSLVTLTPDGTHDLVIEELDPRGWLLRSNESITGGNHTMKVALRYEKDGLVLTHDQTVIVNDNKREVTGIEVAGNDRINEDQTTNLTVKLLNDDGTKTNLDSVVSSVITQSPEILTISKSGGNIVVRAPKNLTEDTQVTITVEHTVDGTPFTDDFVLTVVNSIRGVADWYVTGPEVVHVGRKFVEQYSYGLHIDYDDNTSVDDARAAEWRIQDNPNVVISNQDTGRINFTINESDVTESQTFTIEARSAIDGTSKWKSKVVTIEQQPRDQIEFRLHGDNELNENVVSTEYIGQAHFGSNWYDDCVLKSLTIVGESHGATIVNGNQIDTAKVTAEQTLRIRGTFDWMEMVDNVAEFDVTLKNNMIDFSSATFKQSGGEKAEGTEVNPMEVTVKMSNNTTRNLTAKSVSITQGANLVDVSGSGANTRWTVKSGLAADGLVEWTGVVTVDGIDEQVTKGSFTAKKVEAFAMKTGFSMAEALQPPRLADSVAELLPLMEADHYYFEITDDMAAKAKVGGAQYTGDIDLQLNSAPDGTYPVYPEPAPYSTTHVITKAKWGRPVFVNILGQAESIHCEGARTYKPRDTLETLSDTPPMPWELTIDAKYDTHLTQLENTIRVPYSYIAYTDPNDGEQYIMTRGGMPAAPTVGRPMTLYLRFVDWEVPFPA